MTAIIRLNISAVRNIKDISVSPGPGVNLFHGANGSGKTSILEAIHSLATGKSFRSSKLDLMVQNGSQSALVFVELVSSHKFGFVKAPKESPLLKLDGDHQKNWEAIARLLPILVLDSNTFQLADGGPQARRSFLDWGVFHVEPGFLSDWRNVKKCLAQRNLLLKKKPLVRRELLAWDEELSNCAESVDSSRRKYIELFLPLFEETYALLSPTLAESFSLTYSRGWDDSKHLREVLAINLDLDIRYGSTQAGPHRAELQLKIGKDKAIDVLSRGQLKVLVMALRISQGKLLNSLGNNLTTFLVDDLAAELDVSNRTSVLGLLTSMSGQVFITAVDERDIKSCLPESATPAVFHVERGIIAA